MHCFFLESISNLSPVLQKQDSGHKKQDSGLKKQEPVLQKQDSGQKKQDSGLKKQEPSRMKQDSIRTRKEAADQKQCSTNGKQEPAQTKQGSSSKKLSFNGKQESFNKIQDSANKKQETADGKQEQANEKAETTDPAVSEPPRKRLKQTYKSKDYSNMTIQERRYGRGLALILTPGLHLVSNLCLLLLILITFSPIHFSEQMVQKVLKNRKNINGETFFLLQFITVSWLLKRPVF